MDISSGDFDYNEYAWIWDICPWSDKQIQLFSNLPLDVVRLVFEKAIEDKPRPLHLLLVCQQARRWLEPLIYRHVSLEGENYFKKFYQTFRERRRSTTKDYVFFQRNVRTFFMAGSNRAEKTTTIIRGLTGLRCLACWDADWGRAAMNVVLDSATVRDGKDMFPYKHLRRLSFSATLLVERNFTFMHRALRDITHLDIYFDPIANWESLQSMQHLSHISIDLVTNSPPQSISMELFYWFRRILDACPPSVKVVIFGIVDEFNADFDLIDSEGNYLPPGWPPREPGLEVDDWADWLVFGAHCHDSVDLDVLHPIAQLALGKVDPRAVAGAVIDNLPLNQLFKNLLVYFVWPGNKSDWDWTESNHRDCWTIAEDVIEKRKGLTYAKLVSQVL